MNKELKQELEEIAPLLSSLPKKEIEAPEAYFNTFSSRVMDRIKNENIAHDAKIIRFNHWKKYLAAAMVLLSVGISFYIFEIQNDATNDPSNMEDLYLAELDESTIIEFTNTVQSEDLKNDIDIYQQYLDEQSIIEEL
jgi:hypothetical protein